ncbi:MAG: glycosyltransferase family 2 protein, partial [Parvularculaceae bacterium]|nr:glycosyltransferase family 2 protein [Parvularculaceae bacterium]
MATITVIIVNYNSGDRLGKCLDCLRRQTFTDFDVIVIDNDSTDSSAKTAREKYAEHTFIDAGANLGFAAANNRAAQQASGDWLAFLNPDAYAEPSWLEELINASARHQDADAFGSTQLDASDDRRVDGAGDVMHALGVAYRGGFGWPADSLPPEGECFSPCAAAAMNRRAVFNELGGFDERFFCYGEDVDLGFRLRLIGGRSIQAPLAVVRHEGSGVTGRHSPFSIYHGHRNRIWLSYKCFPAAYFWGLAPLRLIVDSVLAIKSIASGYGGAYLCGVWDGYRGVGKFSRDHAAIH